MGQDAAMTPLHDDLDARTRELRRELDARAERDEAVWRAQRQAIRRRIRSQERAAERPHEPARSRPWLRAAGTAAALATAAATLLVLAVDPSGLPWRGLPWETRDAAVPISEPPTTEVDATAELLRAVERTLAADVAPPLAAADLLLARLEAEYDLATRSDLPDDPHN